MQEYMVSAETGICVILMIFLLITNSLSIKRKKILFSMVLASMVLALSEQLARAYNGDASEVAFYVTRISKFFHYELNLLNIYIFSLYLKDMLKSEGGLKRVPRSLVVNDAVLLVGSLVVIVSQFTGIYYSYDANNVYHRAGFYGVSYVFSSVAITIVAVNIIRYR
jgi:TRAP-type uncharacterized transport system fused permease subunit